MGAGGRPEDEKIFPTARGIEIHTPEANLQPGVIFKPFAHLPNAAIEAMRRGAIRVISGHFIFESVRGRLIIWGGLSGEISPENFEGDDPYSEWLRETPHYELYPELLIPPIDPALDLMTKYSLRVKGVPTSHSIQDGEEVFSQVAHEVFQDRKAQGRLSLAAGSIPPSDEYVFAPSVGVDIEKVREIEATWIPIGQAVEIIPISRRLGKSS